MSALNDATGKRFGRLFVIERAPNTSNGRAQWLCLCDCGKKAVVVGYALRGGAVRSCGCLSRETLATHNGNRRTHGKSGSPEFSTWTSMISRCTNRRDYRFKNYGGRGISVCQRWLDSFENFLVDVGSRPFNGAELDRIDNDGNYEPGNVRWTTSLVNNRNRRTCRRISYKGIALPMIEWAERTGIPAPTIRTRLEAGWTVERALTQPVRRQRNNFEVVAHASA